MTVGVIHMVIGKTSKNQPLTMSSSKFRTNFKHFHQNSSRLRFYKSSTAVNKVRWSFCYHVVQFYYFIKTYNNCNKLFKTRSAKWQIIPIINCFIEYRGIYPYFFKNCILNLLAFTLLQQNNKCRVQNFETN